MALGSRTLTKASGCIIGMKKNHKTLRNILEGQNMRTNILLITFCAVATACAAVLNSGGSPSVALATSVDSGPASSKQSKNIICNVKYDYSLFCSAGRLFSKMNE